MTKQCIKVKLQKLSGKNCYTVFYRPLLFVKDCYISMLNIGNATSLEGNQLMRCSYSKISSMQNQKSRNAHKQSVSKIKLTVIFASHK